MNQASGLRIERARLHYSPPDGATRLHSALNRVSLASIGIKPDATLVIGKFATRIPLARFSIDPFVFEMEENLRTRAAAVRNAGGQIGEDQLFESPSRLAVALASAIVEGYPPKAQRWISAATLGKGAQPWLREFARAHIAQLPQFIATLHAKGHAAAWLTTLDPAEVTAIRMRIALWHGAIPEQLADPIAAASKTKIRNRVNPHQAGAAVLKLLSDFPSAPFPVAIRQCLMVALIAHRRPAIIATASFVAAHALIADMDWTSSPAKMNILLPRRVDHQIGATSACLKSTSIADQAQTSSWRETNLPISNAVPQASSNNPPAQFDESPAQFAPAHQPLHADPQPIAIFSDSVVFHSAFGGMFFLINALTALGIYGDFSRPLTRLAGLSPYELLYLLGKIWFGKMFTLDPLAIYLIGMAGLSTPRDVGRDFTPPPWLTPADWLVPWPKAKRVRRQTSTRITHRHPAGFVVAERWRVKPSVDQVRQRWVSNLAAYLAARTRKALGSDNGRAAIIQLCQISAQICSQAEKLDVQFDLATHDLALRIAGLDRDIGWLPAGGHDIRFIFA